MRATHVFAGVAVSDFTVARDWYERLLGSAPDSLPKEGEAVWRPAASASIYVTLDRARAGSGLLTLAVENLDELRRDLARRGLPVDDGSEANGMRTLLATDPDGNTIKFFEDPGSQ
jgi:catechol 2,3-dioxygenase-like lactoylglutathione lyase family enzyme